MTPILGQQVYSRDGTVWLGSVTERLHSSPLPLRTVQVVRVSTFYGLAEFLKEFNIPSPPDGPTLGIFEWSRNLGGWLAL